MENEDYSQPLSDHIHLLYEELLPTAAGEILLCVWSTSFTPSSLTLVAARAAHLFLTSLSPHFCDAAVVPFYLTWVSCWALLTKATPAALIIPKSCHTSPIQQSSQLIWMFTLYRVIFMTPKQEAPQSPSSCCGLPPRHRSSLP